MRLAIRLKSEKAPEGLFRNFQKRSNEASPVLLTVIRPGERISEISPLSGKAWLVETTREEQSQPDVVRKIDLSVSGAEGFLMYANTPALIDAVSLRTTDDEIDTYIDRHEIAVLALALTDPIGRAPGGDHPLGDDRRPDVSPLSAEINLQALEPVVHEYVEPEEGGSTGL